MSEKKIHPFFDRFNAKKRSSSVLNERVESESSGSDVVLLDHEENHEEIQNSTIDINSSKRFKTSNEEKGSEVGRSYKIEWEYHFFVSQFKIGKKTIFKCLLCLGDPSNVVNVLKKYNVQRHFTSLHAEKIESEGIGISKCEKSEYKKNERLNKIKSLREQFENSQKILQSQTNPKKQGQIGSLELSNFIGKHKKPFSDGDYLKEAITLSAKRILPSIPGITESMMRAAIDTFNQIPLSRKTTTTGTQVNVEIILSFLTYH
jgi:hypothetical protein